MPTGVYERTPAHARVLANNARGHGHSSAGHRTPTYCSWQNMISRCNHGSAPSYPNYGGRGITVCERWRKFANFLADMGERPEGMTLDRVDNDGNYEPGNCRWADKATQAVNRPFTDSMKASLDAGRRIRNSGGAS